MVPWRLITRFLKLCGVEFFILIFFLQDFRTEIINKFLCEKILNLRKINKHSIDTKMSTKKRKQTENKGVKRNKERQN